MQQALKNLFGQWGRPCAIRADNGRPFGDPQRTSVSQLSLWLIGTGIEMIWNRPRCPRDNAKVERMQATTARWVEAQKCSSVTELQTKLDQAAQVHTEAYGVKRLGHRCRKQVYPDLWTNKRLYRIMDFDISRVYHYLSEVLFARKVNNHGIFHFYGQSVYVGRAYKYQTVLVQLDPSTKRFNISNEHNQPMASLTADNFTKKRICNLTVCDNRYVKCQNLPSQKSAKT